MTFLRAHLQRATGYRPSEQPALGSPILKLNTNENPYPPSPEVAKALQSLDLEWLRRYPDSSAQMFRGAVSDVLQVAPESILVGNGGDELLALLLHAFVDPDAKVVYPVPTYVLYRTLAELQNARPVEIPYEEEGDRFCFPLRALAEAQGAITLVASPNSPTGHCVSVQELEVLATALNGVLVIDEAYVDFTDTNALHLVQDHPNVVVLRTLSKGYSLAGLRIGFAIAQPDLIRDLRKVKDSYAVDAVAMLAGTAAFRDQVYKDLNVAKVLQSRFTLQQQLADLDFKVWPSEANFLMVQPPTGIEALTLQQTLKQQGILIRHFDLPSVADKLRITVGTDDQNERLCRQLKALCRLSIHPGS